ncbi:hypothetical protein T4A_5233 [Trichinella pseudospiralis]|uniref:Uncharacterized protein n=1 Tax=Trichinella pseudospiralis TaxID=6337 RepID=A0A0V1E3P8_TRIPS|nr:hypothetical protein T4A_5233 [Trichinella pseudospiralis]
MSRNEDILDVLKNTEWRNLIKKIKEYEAARKETANLNYPSNLSNLNDNQAAISRANRSIQPEQQGEDDTNSTIQNNQIYFVLQTILKLRIQVLSLNSLDS